MSTIQELPGIAPMPPAALRVLRHAQTLQLADALSTPTSAEHQAGYAQALRDVAEGLHREPIYNQDHLLRQIHELLQDNAKLRRREQLAREQLEDAERECDGLHQMADRLCQDAAPAANTEAFNTHQRYRLWFLLHDPTVQDAKRVEYLRHFTRHWTPPTYQHQPAR